MAVGCPGSRLPESPFTFTVTLHILAGLMPQLLHSTDNFVTFIAKFGVKVKDLKL